MAKSVKRSESRKKKLTIKRKNRDRRDRRTRRNRSRKGGEAPVNYSLSGDWSSRMSLGQGADYFKYHEGQHGGALGMGPYPAAVLSPGLPQDLRGPAHVGGIDKAIADVRGLSDAPTTMGGRSKKNKKNKSKKNKSRSKSKSKKNRSKSKSKSKKNKRDRRNRRKRGGSLGFAPFPSQGMLLDSSKAYAQAGLNPEWKTDIAFTDAKIRDTQ
uniref:Uncharacterized protein n=1 Tax=viral metagenome TaxID=1070528 RepID=A0A6C0KPM7_9ZZZZ